MTKKKKAKPTKAKKPKPVEEILMSWTAIMQDTLDEFKFCPYCAHELPTLKLSEAKKTNMWKKTDKK